MTIFDLKPIEINTSMESSFSNKFKLSPWYFDLNDSNNEYKFKGTRNSKKKVTFADEKGSLLVNVIIVEKIEFPEVCSLLQIQSSKAITKVEKPSIKVIQPHEWVTSFIQPASIYNRFKLQLLKQNVKLATAIIIKNSSSNSENDYQMTGVIKVINLCFQKRVFVRLSSDSKWTSSTDFDAKYKSASCEYVPETNEKCYIDEFDFQVRIPNTLEDIPTNLEFAIGLETPLGNYWDSNCDKNYRLDYLPESSDNGTGRDGPANHSTMVHGPYTLDYKPNLCQFKNQFTQYRAWNHFSDEMSFY